MPTLDAHIVKRRRALTVDVRMRLEQGERLALFGASELLTLAQRKLFDSATCRIKWANVI